jgi:hypothetical protein
VAEWLGRGLQSLVQRFESARRLLAALLLVTVALAGCGSSEGPPSASTYELDASQLVVQLSDLPDGFSFIPAESSSVPLAKVLADPFLGGSSALIERERMSGYQMAFVSPAQTRLQCSAAVYRSKMAAKQVYDLRTSAFAEFVARTGGAPLRFPKIGEKTNASRFLLGDKRYYGVTWRFRNVLAACVTGSFVGSPEADLQTVASAQQARIAGTLDEGQR